MVALGADAGRSRGRLVLARLAVTQHTVWSARTTRDARSGRPGGLGQGGPPARGVPATRCENRGHRPIAGAALEPEDRARVETLEPARRLEGLLRGHDRRVRRPFLDGDLRREHIGTIPPT